MFEVLDSSTETATAQPYHVTSSRIREDTIFCTQDNKPDFVKGREVCLSHSSTLGTVETLTEFHRIHIDKWVAISLLPRLNL